MAGQGLAKKERIVEAVRHGLEGDAAVEFIHKSGYAISTAGIARHLRTLGGRGKVQELIAQGLTNHQVLRACLPEEDLSDIGHSEEVQGYLFEEAETPAPEAPQAGPLYETAKVSVRLPSDLYEALRLAAKGEGKSQNQLIVDILTSALSRMPDLA